MSSISLHICPEHEIQIEIRLDIADPLDLKFVSFSLVNASQKKPRYDCTTKSSYYTQRQRKHP